MFEFNTNGQFGSIIGVIEFEKSISFWNTAPFCDSLGLIAPITDKIWTKILMVSKFSNTAEKTTIEVRVY